MKYIKKYSESVSAVETGSKRDIILYSFCKMFLNIVFAKDFIESNNTEINNIIERNINSHDVKINYSKEEDRCVVITCSDEESIIFDKGQSNEILYSSYDYDDLYAIWDINKPHLVKDSFHYFKEFINDIMYDISSSLIKNIEI